MSGKTVTQLPTMSMYQMFRESFHTMTPVERRRVIGMVRRAELQAGRGRPVEAVLDPFVHKTRPGAAIETLLPVLSSGQAQTGAVRHPPKFSAGGQPALPFWVVPPAGRQPP